MQRTPEPDLMNDPAQARAYAEADFAVPHEGFVDLFLARFPDFPATGEVLDLGCGPGDVCMRFARRFPEVVIHGIDGAEAMLAEGRRLLGEAGLAERVQLHHGYLPGAVLPRAHYATLISNSLLHHLNDPMLLWHALRDHAEPGARIFVMDLMRPETPEQALGLVEQYAAGEPEVLRHDFHMSLHAAYTPEEVRGQLAEAGLALVVEVVSDRHLIAYGRR